MKKLIGLLGSILLFASLGFGQILGVTFQGGVAPTTNCNTLNAFYVNTTANTLYICVAGSYTQFTNSSGGGTLSVANGGTGLTSGTSGGILGFTASGTIASSVALTSNVLTKGGGAGATPTNSSITDNGTTISTAEPLTLSAATNQLVLGTTNTVTLTAPAPASALVASIPVVVSNFNIITSPPPISAVGATLSLTTAQCGQLVQMGATTGEVVTLPNPSGFVGCSYDFVITVTNTSNFNEIRTDSGSRFLLGAVEHSATGIAPLTFWADGSTIQALKMDGAHLGGLIGSVFHVVAISATQWEITGRNEGTATMTTAFNAAP